MVCRQLLENHSNPCIKLFLFQIFMILPLGLIYILGNIIFQEVVKISPKNNFTCIECWNHTQWNDHIRYFSVFELVDWYLNPLFWVGIFCFLQALSHIFERKYINQASVKLRAKDPKISKLSCIFEFKISCLSLFIRETTTYYVNSRRNVDSEKSKPKMVYYF